MQEERNFLGYYCICITKEKKEISSNNTYNCKKIIIEASIAKLAIEKRKEIISKDLKN